MNNRKRTKGRKIQTVMVATTVKRTVGKGDDEKTITIPNPSPRSGKLIQIRHK